MGIDFRYRSGLKNAKSDIFWSEIRSGFGEPGGTPPPGSGAGCKSRHYSAFIIGLKP